MSDEKPVQQVEHDLGCGALLAIIVICATALLLFGCAPGAAYDCRAIDGDTLDCAGERVRLLGIDAPEKREPGGAVSTEFMALLLDQWITLDRQGYDRYGRTLAHAYGKNGGSLACSSLLTGNARYVRRWDNLPQGRLARECR